MDQTASELPQLQLQQRVVVAGHRCLAEVEAEAMGSGRRRLAAEGVIVAVGIIYIMRFPVNAMTMVPWPLPRLVCPIEADEEGEGALRPLPPLSSSCSLATTTMTKTGETRAVALPL